MRTPTECESKRSGLGRRLAAMCPHHDHPLSAQKLGTAEFASCDCWKAWNSEYRAFEACVPKKFWNVQASDVHENRDVFDEVISRYVTDEKLRIAILEGAGLFLAGANGVGKTMFLSWILMELIRNRNVTVYYTSTLRLDSMVKQGFGDKEVERRLASMMKRNFVVIDELGKEQFKSGDSFTRREIEKLLRYREENNLPTLLASNSSLDVLSASPDNGGYGSTFASLIAGSYLAVQMGSGDYRLIAGGQLQERMMA